MRIRLAKPEDAKPIAEVHVAAWQAAYRGLMPDSYLDELTVEKRTVLWHRALTQPSPGTLVVAENQESLVGFCFFGPTRDEDGKDKSVGEIVALNVRPVSWRSGFGRALCDFVLHEAPCRNWKLVTLWVLKGNEPACRFYEALGFSLDGIARIDTKLIGAPIHELRYCKTASQIAV
jgi:RimJ/RimL family protein N-acetyltransferase